MSFPGFPKKSKLSSINFCFAKNGVSVYLVSEKCQYLRSGFTDFRFKSRFGNVYKFYKKLSNTWMRFDHEICIKKSLEVDGRSKNKLSKILWMERANWNLFGTPGTIPHPSPSLVFFDNFFRPKIASREPCISFTLEVWGRIQGWPTRGPERNICGPILDWNSDCFFTFFVEIWPKESIFLEIFLCHPCSNLLRKFWF
jgi:hypothetical protein